MNEKPKTQSKTKEKTPAIHAGHRRRMFEKLKNGALLEHELLETLLFFVIPRQNTNEIAHRLLAKFKTISGVFNATAEELAEVEGIGRSSSEFLQCIGALVGEYSKGKNELIPAYYDTEAFIGYTARQYASLEREVLDIFFLGDDAHIYFRRRFHGDKGSVQIMAKWLQELIIELNPTGIVVVHNHPSGSAHPSLSDRVMIEKIQAMCLSNAILLCDFCISAKDGVFSFYKTGALKDVSQTMIDFNGRERPIVDWEVED